MQFRLPQYSGRDYLVLGISLVPMTLALNCIIFGARYFTHWTIFIPATLITALIFSIQFVLCTYITIWFKRRMPAEEQTTRRLIYLIFCVVDLSGIFLLTLFHGYEFFAAFNYSFNEKGFIWAY